MIFVTVGTQLAFDRLVIAMDGWAAANPGYLAETHDSLMNWYKAGWIKARVGHTYPLSDLPHALRDLANRKILGKTVVIS